MHGTVRTARLRQRTAVQRSPDSRSGASVKFAKLDVTDKEGMAAFLLTVDAETPVECAGAREQPYCY